MKYVNKMYQMYEIIKEFKVIVKLNNASNSLGFETKSYEFDALKEIVSQETD